MEVRQYVNQKFNSNTYKISLLQQESIWFIDLGSFSDQSPDLLQNHPVKGAFLTHYHYDHVFDIELFSHANPTATVFASQHTVSGLGEPKQNLSFYHEQPITYSGKNVNVITEEDQINLSNDAVIQIIETPGHNPGCLSYKIGKYIFTGDSYIPYTNVVTKLKGGDKLKSRYSLMKIRGIIDEDTIICPGHGPMIPANEILEHLDSLIDSETTCR